MGELVPLDGRSVCPIHRTPEARALDAMPEGWGYGGKELLPQAPPPRPVVTALRDRLRASLAPAGPEAGLQAAALLVESYPQADRSGRLYAEAVAQRLAECPPDLLMSVVNHLLDSLTYRPAVAEVAQAVKAAVGSRKLLLMRADAALRWHDWNDDQVVLAGEPRLTPDQAAEVRNVLAGFGLRSPEAVAEADTPPRPGPRHLEADQLAAAYDAAKRPNPRK